ncbi:hypothetical protein N0B44_05945 [Roseibacterium beibuensis]|uniref:hypothetical protein n=1 Tax=[Roseibacterium] beibuensis TaxID=1193142 RepID=UPI00217F1771|nr:hypothetical protein [Roseibacterium beibuensis]MCS6622449.1 hypothetical protein [Roseibacterium beibuensis]
MKQIYDLEQRISSSAYIHKDEVERFVDQFFKGDLKTQDRLTIFGHSSWIQEVPGSQAIVGG